jgi:uncharacterized glyoxalase superfamily protein PhnB
MTTKLNKTDIQPIPAGYHTVTPWIIVKGAAQLIDFLKKAFGAEEIGGRVYNEDGTIGHAEVQIGDSVVMMFDSRPEWPATPSFLRLYVEDADAVFKQAVAAGGSVVTEVTELFWGDRIGRVRDPFGNIWWIQARVENIDPEEMRKRAGEQKYLEAMKYVQDSLTRELGK